MELFVIKNRRGEVVKGGFKNKGEAKQVRNELQAASKNGLPRPEHASISSCWDFHISYGKDHDRYAY